MLIFVNLSVLFVCGSLFGWMLELLYKRLFSVKKWVNPGFLSGPFLPIYGTGVVAFYLVSHLPMSNWMKVLTLILGITIIEYLIGLFFLKVMRIRLWDYSDLRGNIDGLICPLFSLIWGILGYIFIYYLSGPIKKALALLHLSKYNVVFYILLGVVIGFVIVDVIHNFNLTNKIRKTAHKAQTNIRYEKLKVFMSEQQTKRKSFLFPIKASENMQENINKFISTIKRFIYKD